MRKRLDTRFPAARIKKIMQSDEEVGKIASATPVLVSKALELFLQDLCDRTYEITLKRGAKIMSSFHLKECVQIHNVFDFLQETVSHVPDLGCNRGGQNGRRRKTADGENDDSCEEDIKRSKGTSQELAVSSRGRRRGRGRGRGRKIVEKNDAESDQLDDPETAYSPQLSDECETHFQNLVTKGESSEAAVTSPQPQPKDFDLNLELDENGEVAGLHTSDLKLKSFKLTGWLPPYQTNSHLFEVSSHQNVLQSEEDYDCEDDC